MSGYQYHDLAHVTPRKPPKTKTDQEYRAWEARSAAVTVVELAGWPETDNTEGRAGVDLALQVLGLRDLKPREREA